MFEELLARRGLSLERLQSFLMVAEAGSIARAAGGDAVRQSQFSRQIGELEEFFRVELTKRSGRSVALTEAGRELATLVRMQFRGFEDFLRRRSDAATEVAIGAGDSLITWVLVPKIAEFQRRFPRSQVKVFNLRSAEVIQQVLDARLDFGLARAGFVRAPLKHAILGKVQYRLFVPKRLQREAAHLSPLEMLKRFPVTTLGSDAELFDSLLGPSELRGASVNIKLVTESFPQAARAVLGGSYAGILPAHAAVDLEPRGVVGFELPFLRDTVRRIALVWSARMMRIRPEGDAMKIALRDLLSLE